MVFSVIGLWIYGFRLSVIRRWIYGLRLSVIGIWIGIGCDILGLWIGFHFELILNRSGFHFEFLVGFDTPNDFRSLFDSGIVLGPTSLGLLFTDEYLHIGNLFRERPVELLFNNEDLNLNRLFLEPEPVGLLFADEDLHLNQLFEEPEVPEMAALGGEFNPNILLNALNNLTNTLGVGGNNWANVNNAVNTLNATLMANNNALQTCGTQSAQVPIFYGGNQDPIAWFNEFNLACAANGWNNARKLQIVPAYLKGAAAVWYQTVVRNPINAWDGAVNNNMFEHVFK
ncbi:unnamed protein product [Rhizophagus irregularis]|nr:unnamed protein product [Rhizophagus irregularis]